MNMLRFLESSIGWLKMKVKKIQLLYEDWRRMEAGGWIVGKGHVETR